MLSTKDKEKPFILLGAVIAGLVIQRIIGSEIPLFLHLTEIGVFLVILAVMLQVEIKDVSKAFAKLKPTVIALLINFLFIPVFSWAMGWFVLKNYPDFWAGAILYTLTPCIGWYLIFTDIAKGNVAWGIALLPWNITLQILLMPFYLYILIGKVIPVDLSVLIRSIILFLVIPFILAYIGQKVILSKKGKDFFYGPFKALLNEIKLWALVVVILSMFISQKTIHFAELPKLTLLIFFLIVFFLVLFLIALLIGKIFKLNYEDIVTLAFTTTARNSEAVIGIAMVAFPGKPLIYLAIILGPIVELPMLILIARLLLNFRKDTL